MPPGDGTQIWDILISSIDYKNICEDTQKMQVSFRRKNVHNTG